MPSFDIVSELNLHEVANAIDQANREVGTRFDFKGVGAKYELNEAVVTLVAEAEFQLKQMLDILRQKLAKRAVDLACMKIDEPLVVGQTAKQVVTLRQGIETELGKKIQRLIKDSKLKVQAAIQDKQVRVTGKSRDDLQSVIALMRSGKLDMPLQYTELSRLILGMPAMRNFSYFAIGLTLLLTACGLRGPLYLPEPAKQVEAEPQASTDTQDDTGTTKKKSQATPQETQQP